jgi:hypothetical protein
MATKTQYFYYRIYDDTEQFHYIKSSCEQKKLRSILKRYEKKNQEYYNAEFLKFLRQFDTRAELIDVVTVTY